MPIQVVKKVKKTISIAQRIKQFISAFITTLLAIINPIVALVVLILAIISTATIVTNLDAYIAMTDTWKLAPISDVQIIVIPEDELRNDAPPCADGYRPISHGSVSVESCVDIDGDRTCTRSNRALKFFGRNRICVREDGIPARKRRCAAEHPVNCAKDACQPEGVDCPMNDIVWLPADEDPDFSFASYVDQTPGRKYFNLSTQVTDNDDRVYFTNTADLFPIVRLSVSGSISRYSEELHRRGNVLQMLEEQFGSLALRQSYVGVPDAFILSQLREVPFECASRPTETTRDKAVSKAEEIRVISTLTILTLVFSSIAFLLLSIGIPFILAISCHFCALWCPGKMDRIFQEYGYAYFELKHRNPLVLEMMVSLRKERFWAEIRNIVFPKCQVDVPEIPSHYEEEYHQVDNYLGVRNRRLRRIVCPIIGAVFSLTIDTVKLVFAIVIVTISWQVRNFFASIYSDACARASEPGEESVKFVKDHVQQKSSIYAIFMVSFSVAGIVLSIIGCFKDGLLTLCNLRRERIKTRKISEDAMNQIPMEENT